MSESEFGEATLKTLFYRIEGFNELEEDREKQHWERARWMVYFLYQRTKRGQFSKLTDFVTFYWETKKTKKLSKEELDKKFEELDRKTAKIDKKKGWKEITNYAGIS